MQGDDFASELGVGSWRWPCGFAPGDQLVVDIVWIQYPTMVHATPMAVAGCVQARYCAQIQGPSGRWQAHSPHVRQRDSVTGPGGSWSKGEHRLCSLRRLLCDEIPPQVGHAGKEPGGPSAPPGPVPVRFQGPNPGSDFLKRQLPRGIPASRPSGRGQDPPQHAQSPVSVSCQCQASGWPYVMLALVMKVSILVICKVIIHKAYGLVHGSQWF